MLLQLREAPLHLGAYTSSLRTCLYLSLRSAELVKQTIETDRLGGFLHSVPKRAGDECWNINGSGYV